MVSKLEQASKIIHRLIAWDEVTRFELDGVTGSQDWITALENVGLLHAGW
jgi:hypothetical protein